MRRERLLTPGPVEVHPDVLAASAQQPLHHRSPEFIALSHEVWRRLQYAFDTTSMVVVQAGSGMTGLESAIASVHAPGERIVVFSHGRFGDRLPTIARRYGLHVTTVEVPWGESYDAAWVEQHLTNLLQPADGVWLVHAETSSGVGINLPTITAAIRRVCPQAIIGVDTVTSLGVQELRFDRWDLDVAVAGIQKGLACPPGLAVTALSARALERIASQEARTYTLHLATVIQHEREGLFAWTPPVTLMVALDAALRRLQDVGLEATWAAHQQRHRAIVDTAAAHGVPTLGMPTAMGIVALRVDRSVEIRRTMLEVFHLRVAGGQDHLADTVMRIGTMGGTWSDGTDDLLKRVQAALHHCLESRD